MPKKPSQSASKANAQRDSQTKAAGATQNFEQSIQRLAAIVEQLEQGELPLEDSLKLFEEGVLLSRSAQQILDTAERKVEQLLGFDQDGEPIVEPLDDEV